MRINRAIVALAVVLLTASIVGLTLRYTVRDRIDALAPLFYALAPLAVVILATASLGLWLWARARLGVAFSGIVVALAFLAWIQTDYVRGDHSRRRPSDLRIVMWNIARPSDGQEGFLLPLERANADIALVVESQAYGEGCLSFWESHFPEHHIFLVGAGMTLLSRYPISEVSMHAMGRGTCIVRYQLATPFGTISVVAVDIESSVLRSRSRFIEQAYEIATSQPGPVIVLGDFNTPHTSVFFADFYRSFQHAFARSGNGLITTWRTFLPVLALDHIWLSHDFVPVHATLWRTLYSDHAMAIADVAMRGGESPETRSDRDP